MALNASVLCELLFSLDTWRKQNKQTKQQQKSENTTNQLKKQTLHLMTFVFMLVTVNT